MVAALSHCEPSATGVAAVDAEMTRLATNEHYRQAMLTIAEKNREIERLKNAMAAVDTALPRAIAAGDQSLMRECVQVLRTARGVR